MVPDPPIYSLTEFESPKRTHVHFVSQPYSFSSSLLSLLSLLSHLKSAHVFNMLQHPSPKQHL